MPRLTPWHWLVIALGLAGVVALLRLDTAPPAWFSALVGG